MILINPSSRDALKCFQPFLPVFVPVGLGALMAVLEREGIEACCVDEQIEEDALPRIRQAATGLKPPYIFGFSVLTASFKRAAETSLILKRLYPDSVIVFGGAHPTANPEEALTPGYADIVVRGEGDRILPELYRRIKNGRDFADLPGLSWRDGGRIVHNERAPIVDDMDSLPPFPYHRFEQHRDRYDLGFVASSRGCPYNCVFCSNRVTTGKHYRFRSNDAVIAEIELLRGKYGLRNVIFLDDNLLVNKPRVFELTEQIRRRGFDRDMNFSFQARGDNVNREILADMRRSGFNSIFFGMETTSESVMKFINKGETVACCVAAARLAKELRFHVSATFIFGLPGETHRDRMDAVCLAREIGIDMVRFNNATPYPGTALWDIAKRDGGLRVRGMYENFNSVSTFVENPFRPIPFSYVPAGAAEAGLREDILTGYLAFYLDPQKVRRILSEGRKEGAGWFTAGGSWWARLRLIPALLTLGLLLFAKFGWLTATLICGRGKSVRFREFLQVILGRRKSGLVRG